MGLCVRQTQSLDNNVILIICNITVTEIIMLILYVWTLIVPVKWFINEICKILTITFLVDRHSYIW